MNRWVPGLLASAALVALAGCQPGDAVAETREWVCDGYVALTYDDGPSDFTREVSESLVQEGMMATFFLVGDQMNARPEEAQRLLDDGHNLGTHTMTHPDLIEDANLMYEIPMARDLLYSQTQEISEWFRPPYGSTNETVRDQVEQAGMTEVIWTLDTFDWQGHPAEDIAAVFENAEDGDIVLMHDSRQSAVDAVPLIADVLAERGLCAGELALSDSEIEVWEGQTHRVTAVRPGYLRSLGGGSITYQDAENRLRAAIETDTTKEN